MLVSAHGLVGNLEAMEQAFEEMMERRIRPNVVVYTSLIAVYSRQGKHAKAWQVRGFGHFTALSRKNVVCERMGLI